VFAAANHADSHTVKQVRKKTCPPPVPDENSRPMPSRAEIPLLQIDAFAPEQFTGNPAAVCLPGTEPPASWMQQVAAEMNLSETAFAWPNGDGFSLRWFTPIAEVDLCGHATLATAHALWETGRLANDQTAIFQTRSGRLNANKNGRFIELDFPSESATPCKPTEALSMALDTDLLWCGQNRFDYLVQVSDEPAVLDLQPDLARLAKLDARGVIVTAEAKRDGADFVSRFFCPALGIDEDPVTGSAHCCLAPFWAERLGRDALVGFQASERGGWVQCTLDGKRVRLSGQAVTIFSSTMHISPPGT